MRLEDLTRPELIFPAIQATDADGALRACAQEIAAAARVADADELYQKLVEREKLGSTAVGGGVAIPHCKLRGLRQPVVAIGRVEPGIEFGAPDGQPVRLLFVVVSPIDTPAEHLQVLSAVSRWIKDGTRIGRLLELREREQIWELLGGAAVRGER